MVEIAIVIIALALLPIALPVAAVLAGAAASIALTVGILVGTAGLLSLSLEHPNEAIVIGVGVWLLLAAHAHRAAIGEKLDHLWVYIGKPVTFIALTAITLGAAYIPFIFAYTPITWVIAGYHNGVQMDAERWLLIAAIEIIPVAIAWNIYGPVRGLWDRAFEKYSTDEVC